MLVLKFSTIIIWPNSKWRSSLSENLVDTVSFQWDGGTKDRSKYKTDIPAILIEVELPFVPK